MNEEFFNFNFKYFKLRTVLTLECIDFVVKYSIFNNQTNFQV